MFVTGVSSSGGTFNLVYNNNGTPETITNLPYNDIASDVQNQLSSLAGIGAGNVSVTSSTITTEAIVISGATSGNFNLIFNGTQTGNIAFGATAVQVQAALNALGNIGNPVSPASSPLPYVTVDGAGTSASPYVVTFYGSLGNNAVETLSFSLGSLVGAGPAINITPLTTTDYQVSFINALAATNPSSLTAVSTNLIGVAGSTFPGTSAPLATVTTNSAAGLGGQRVGTVTLSVGNLGSAAINMAPGTTISLAGTGANITVNPFPGATAASGAVISGGTLNLQSQLATVSLARTFTVNDTPAINDLFISSVISDGNNGEFVDTLTISGTTTGLFTLSFNGQTTAALSYNSSPSVVQLAVQSLTGLGGALVTGSANNYTITYTASAASLTAAGSGGATATLTQSTATTYNPVNSMAASLTKNGTGNGRLVLAGSDNYTGTTSVSTGIVTLENPMGLGEAIGSNSQILSVGSTPTSATYILTFAGEGSGQLGALGTLPYNASVAQVQTALQGLTNTVAVTEGAGTAGQFTLSFGGATTIPIAYNAPVATVQTDFQNIVPGGAASVVVGGAVGDYTIVFLGTGAYAGTSITAVNAIGSNGASVNITSGVNNVTVSGTTGSYLVTFSGPWGAVAPLLGVTASTTSLTTSVIPASGTLVAAGAALELEATTAAQTVTINATSGAFNLTFQNPTTFVSQTTADLPYNATAAQVQAALNGLSTIASSGGSVSVTATTSMIAGATNTVYSITFGGSMANTAEPQITGGTSSVNPLSGGLASVAANVDVQLVTVNEPAGSTLGTFALSFNGQTTASMPYNASPAVVTEYLEGLSNVGAGTVSVSGTSGTFTLTFQTSTASGTTTALNYNATPAAVQTALQAVVTGLGYNSSNVTVGGINGDYIIAFSGALLGTPISDLSGPATVTVTPNNNLSVTGFPGAYEIAYGNPFSSSSLALPAIVAEPGNGASTAVLPAGTYSDDIQLLSVNEAANTNSGMYTLSFGGQTTTSLPYNSTPAAVQAALQALSSIGPNNVQVTGSSAAMAIVFDGLFAGQGSAIPLITTQGVSGAATSVVQASSYNQVQVLDITGTTGTYQLTFNGYTTTALQYNATAANVQLALQARTTGKRDWREQL